MMNLKEGYIQKTAGETKRYCQYLKLKTPCKNASVA